jgi:DNA-binding transcriptional LysR family regulator
MDLNDLYYFAQVVDHGGFAAAGRALQVPKSSLSRRVTRLEDRLGVRLVERSTRRFVVTEVGRQFYAHAKAAVAEAEQAEQVAAQVTGEPRGLVKVSAPLSVAQGPLSIVLPAFLAAYPKVRVQLTVTNRRIDLIEEGIDVALRVRQSLDTDAALMIRIFNRERGVLVASPEFVERWGPFETPQQIATVPTLSHRDGGGTDAWVLTHADGRRERVEHEPRLSASDFKTLLQAAVAGVGVAYLPLASCAHHLQTGALVDVLPDWGSSEGIFHLVFTTRRGQRPAVSAFIDFLVERMPEALRGCPGRDDEVNGSA